MDVVLTFLFMFVIGWYFWSAVRAKELAVRAGRSLCEKHRVQFLDETVEQRHIKLTRDSRKNPVWQRNYHFEFATTGEFRYGGQIIMLGHQVQSVEMDPYPEDTLYEQLQ